MRDVFNKSITVMNIFSVCRLWIIMQLFSYLLVGCYIMIPQPVVASNALSQLPHTEAILISDNYAVHDEFMLYGTRYTQRVNFGYSATGRASWYGSEFHGKKSASGLVFDKNLYTAAHKSLPLPSMVRVTNLSNGASLVLLINDRGPANDKLIDVSEVAAKALGFLKVGVTLVHVEYLAMETEQLLEKCQCANSRLNKKHYEIAMQLAPKMLDSNMHASY